MLFAEICAEVIIKSSRHKLYHFLSFPVTMTSSFEKIHRLSISRNWYQQCWSNCPDQSNSHFSKLMNSNSHFEPLKMGVEFEFFRWLLLWYGLVTNTFRLQHPSPIFVTNIDYQHFDTRKISNKTRPQMIIFDYFYGLVD